MLRLVIILAICDCQLLNVTCYWMPGGFFRGQRAHLWILHNGFRLASSRLSSLGLLGKFVIDFLVCPFFLACCVVCVLLAFRAALSAFSTQPSALYKLLILNENNNM